MEEALSDEEALRQWQRGEEEGFEVLYLRHFPRLYRWVAWRIQDPEEAEDIVQETFLRAVQCRDALELGPGGSLYPWLFRVAQRLVALRGRRPPPIPFSDLPPELVGQLEAYLEKEEVSPEAVLLRREWFHLLRKAVAALPEDQRQVVEYRFFAELSWQEIALAMQRSEGAVKMLLQRALRTLRERLRVEAEGALPSRIRRQSLASQEASLREWTAEGRERPPLRGRLAEE